MFLNIAILPRLGGRLRPRPGLRSANLADGRMVEVDAHQARTIPGGSTRERGASAGSGVLEAAMSRDGVAEQLFPSMVIARRMFLASLAIFGLRRSAGKVGKTLEIAHVTQCALQAFCR